MLKKVFLLPLFLFVIITGCKKDSTPATSGVPNVAVSFSINVTSALYTPLLNVGGWVYVTGGYDGIILFCNGIGTYIAFDRGCPYDCETNTKAIVNVQTGGITAVCPVCGTTYSLYSGTTTKGPGSIALKQYHTSFDGSTFLTVSN
jgi:nitrite reductase/ring-hydroxylating ferredoxin subunit